MRSLGNKAQLNSASWWCVLNCAKQRARPWGYRWIRTWTKTGLMWVGWYNRLKYIDIWQGRGYEWWSAKVTWQGEVNDQTGPWEVGKVDQAKVGKGILWSTPALTNGPVSPYSHYESRADIIKLRKAPFSLPPRPGLRSLSGCLRELSWSIQSDGQGLCHVTLIQSFSSTYACFEQTSHIDLIW